MKAVPSEPSKRNALRIQPAQGRTAELEKVNAALQATIEALANEPALESFVPIVLRVTAETFGAASCSFFEVDDNEIICLRYIFHQGRVITPLELPLLDDTKFGTLKRLADGFTVPEKHLGVHATRRNHSVLLDHRIATATPEFHAFAISVGWELELNVPLLVGGKMRGCFLIHRHGDAPFSPSDISLAESLGRQLTLALQASRNAAREREAAIAREREQAAQERAEELAKANDALQATVDATSQVLELDELVPKVLAIIANVFTADTCGVFENLPSGEVRLRYWHSEGRTLLPAELLQLDEKKHSLVRQLAAGFTAPTEYLGQDSRTAGTVFLDHVKGTAVPEFDQWAISIGCDLELNIGIASQGVRCATLCVYRSRQRPYSPREIVLAEALARQIGLALQVTKLSQTTLDAVVAREREQAAQHRAKELARANATVSRSLAAVSQSTDFDDTLEKVFFEIVASAHASTGQLFLHDAKANTLATIVWTDERGHGRGFCPDSPPLLQTAFDADVTPAFRLCSEANDFFAISFKSLTPEQAALAWPGTTEWHLARGRESACAIPILVGQRPVGMIGLAWKDQFSFSTEQRELLFALTNQAAMVMQLRELADSQRATTILQERARFAGQIHDTLAQGFTGTLLHLEALRVRVSRGERVTVEELQGVRKIAALGLAEARRSALAIRPLALDGRDISTALQQLTERSAVPGLLDCRWSLIGLPRPLSSIADEALLNIAHEAVSNAIRHAEASNIHITLAFDPDGVSLRVQDDGIGFDASDSRQRGHTFGLRSMRERALAVCAELTVTSKHGEGTAIIVHLRTA